MDFITTITDRDTWFFRSSTVFNQIYVNGLSGTDGAIYLNGQNIYGQLSGNAISLSTIQGLTGGWESTYSTVQTNSALWEESTDISYLSGRIDINTNNIINIAAISATWNDAYTNLISNSAAYLTAVDISLLASTSANWDSTYTTVQGNSATTWLGDSAVDSLVHSDSAQWYYQGTDLKTLSANWENTFNTVSTLSASWDDMPDLSQYAPLSGASFYGNISVADIINANSFSISGIIGHTHSKRIVLMDEDGDSFLFYLRGGVLTIT
ncbi:MAG: hypothetical protein PHS54_00175 [Clostridia bacterium]|nr:hypothetical protein [Clostridia bacterium]